MLANNRIKLHTFYPERQRDRPDEASATATQLKVWCGDGANFGRYVSFLELGSRLLRDEEWLY
jgi:hypothetical protein